MDLKAAREVNDEVSNHFIASLVVRGASPRFRINILFLYMNRRPLTINSSAVHIALHKHQGDICAAID
eukprot:8768815-Pyramimonas_sp.AAC.1